MPGVATPKSASSRLAHFFHRPARSAIRCPGRTLLVGALITLGAAPGLWRLKLRTDGQALLPSNAPEVLLDHGIREKFGLQDQLVVLIRPDHDRGIFNPETIQLVRELTAALQQLPGIEPLRVRSLATEPSYRLRAGSLIHETMLERSLRTESDLKQLREDLDRIRLYTGTFVSGDGKATVILVGLPPGTEREVLYRRVSHVTERFRRGSAGVGATRIAVTGAPVAELLLGIHILEDLGVPRALLGSSSANDLPFKFFGSLKEACRELTRRAGLVPIAALVMMLVLLLCFRSVVAMCVPLPGIAGTLILLFGLMGWCGVPIYLTMAVMPVMLIATGATNDIYLFNRYFRLLRERPGTAPNELLEATFAKLALPIASTSITAGIGFLSFAFSPLPPVRAFGIFTGIGALVGLVYSLTLVPALLALVRPEWIGRKKLNAPEQLNGFEGKQWLPAGFGRLAGAVVKWRWWVVGAALAVVMITPLGVRRLVVQDSWIDAFDPVSDFRQTADLVNTEFNGMHLLFVSFEKREMAAGDIAKASVRSDGTLLLPLTNAPPAEIAGSAITISLSQRNGPAIGADATAATLQSHVEMVSVEGANLAARIPSHDLTTNFLQNLRVAERVSYRLPLRSQVRPDIIHEQGELARFVRERRRLAVGGVLGPEDYLTTTRFMARPNDPNARELGSDPGEIKLMWDYYGLALGPQRLRQLVDTNYWQAITTVFLKDANFVDTARLMSDLRAYESEHLTPKGIQLGFAGDVALSQALIHGIVTTQLQSLLWSILGIYLVTAWLGGSWRWGFFCVLPSLLAVLIKFAVMGWAGIPLGVATSMFAGMTLGIGVNCAIQLLESYRESVVSCRNEAEALRRAVALTGPPAFINTVAVSLGFGVLMLSQVPANARLGLLVVLGLVNCFLASLLLLPALLHWSLAKPQPACATEHLPATH